MRILLLALEMQTWQLARSHSYSAGLGFEEGFAAHGVDYLTITTPCFRWAQELCRGHHFDQVWLYAVQSGMTDAQRDWVATLAPVRVGIVADSIDYTTEEEQRIPYLATLRGDFEAWLPRLTHVVAYDERLAEYVQQDKRLKAMWCPCAFPARFIHHPPLPAPRAPGLFSGNPYEWREDWFKHSELLGVLEKLGSPEQGTIYPGLFNCLQRNIQRYLNRSWSPFRKGAASWYIRFLRLIRRRSFSRWLRHLRLGAAVVNLPHYFKGYSSRVVEGMGAGRPVLSWRVPDRPLNQALFTDGEEILLFSRDEPEELARHLRRLLATPELGTKIAENARRKILRFHTIEHRVKQILDWIACDVTPRYW